MTPKRRRRVGDVQDYPAPTTRRTGLRRADVCSRVASSLGYSLAPRYRTSLNLMVKVLDFVKSGGLVDTRTQLSDVRLIPGAPNDVFPIRLLPKSI